MFLAPFFHSDEWHLYYNMVSLLWKGRNLELHYGSAYFAYMCAVFAVLVNIVMVGLAMLADFCFYDNSYLWQCGVGFSGDSLFCIVYLLNIINLIFLTWHSFFCIFHS